MKYLISACLLGENCKYNGGNNQSDALIEFLKDKDYVAVCPEVLGGLSIPRPCAEIHANRVITQDLNLPDVTDAYVLGAKKSLDIAVLEGVDQAILQSRSPSCGKGYRYSGDFDGTLIEGNGIFVDLLEKHDVPVVDIAFFLANQKKTDKDVIETMKKAFSADKT